MTTFAGLHKVKVAMDEFTGDLKDVAEILGPEVARELRRVAGGLFLTIPETPPEDGPLAELPADMARKLCATFPRDRLYIAKGAPRPGETRARVLRLRREGMTIQQIARRLRITDRQVRSHLSRARLPTRDAPDLPQLPFDKLDTGDG